MDNVYTPLQMLVDDAQRNHKGTWEELKSAAMDLPYTEAVNSDTFKTLVPALFADAFLLEQTRNQVFKPLLPGSSTSLQDSIIIRRAFRTEGVQVRGENDTLQIVRTSRKRITHKFCELVDAMMYSERSIKDFGSSVGFVAQDQALSLSMFARREDQIASTRFFEGASNRPTVTTGEPRSFRDDYDNWIDSESEYGALRDVIQIIEDMFLLMLTRSKSGDRVRPDILVCTPLIWTKIFTDSRLKFLTVGPTTNLPLNSGVLPAGWPFNLTIVMANELGYFVKDGAGKHVWEDVPHSMILMDSKRAATYHTRDPMSFLDLQVKERFETGQRVAERITTLIQDYRAFVVASPSTHLDTPNMLDELGDLKIDVVDESKE